MWSYQLWTQGQVYNKISFKPMTASWDSKTSKKQIELKENLAKIQTALGPLPQAQIGLFLHMDIEVQKPEHLLQHYDLDNYLFDVVKVLGPQHFNYVSATKRINGGSQLTIGLAKALDEGGEANQWAKFSHRAQGSSVKQEWKEDLRDGLKAINIQQVKPGPVEAHLIWCYSSDKDYRRNWINLWKPTIDAMGPILGELPLQPSRHHFNPDDGRIVTLGLHLNQDYRADWTISIGMMWRAISLMS